MNLIHPIEIGPVRTRSNLILSPMSGVTDCAFRSLVRACSGDAVGLLVSEFLAAEGLSRDNEKTISMMRFKESERPFSIQIFGADVDRMVRAAQMVEAAGADIVDVNCGCPAPKVVRRGGGAELMRVPSRLAEVVRAIRRAVRIPVTVKIRAGWDENSRNAVEIARMLEAEGASMLAVHGRTRVQMYRGLADWDLVAGIRDAIGIPVVGSGDVVRPEHAIERLAAGACDGVMIGRAAMENPWIFAQVRAFHDGRPIPVPDADERIRALRIFRDGLRETRDDRRFVGRFRGLACRFVKGIRDGAAARRAIGAASDVAAVEEIFANFVRNALRPESTRESTQAVA